MKWWLKAPLWGSTLAGLGALGVYLQYQPVDQASTALQCPAGYERRAVPELMREYNPKVSVNQISDTVRNVGSEVCFARKAPESIKERMAFFNERNVGLAAPFDKLPEGYMRAAVEQKAAMQKAQADIPNATGNWAAYGEGPQVSDDKFPQGSIDGIPEVNGRVDNFAYDATAKRLFAAVGNGGIWVSEAKNNDVATLGDSWRPISDTLPSQVNSAVAWTTAGANPSDPDSTGTVVVLTGEHTQGGNSYIGLGVYWSNNLGKTWNHATGVPDGAFSFKLAVDPSNPSIVYAATGKGLFRSVDAARTFQNVKLPVSPECKGVESVGLCGFANFVTDVMVKAPGGTTNFVCDKKGCPVIAAVGYRAGKAKYADGKIQSPGNGLYRSNTGEADSFARLAVAGDGLSNSGFTTDNRVGRIEMGQATGATQNHDYIYALVQDAQLFNSTSVQGLDVPVEQGLPDVPVDCSGVNPDTSSDANFVCRTATKPPNSTYLNGVYVSANFGTSWTRLADDVEIAYNLSTGSALAAVVALGVAPGIQSWYDAWINPDPTQADPITGAPTRLLFGIEEIWKNRVNVGQTGPAQSGNNDYKVVGTYFSGKTCLFLVGRIGPTAPVCPVNDGGAAETDPAKRTTTHPDQHDAIYIPDPTRGGVWLFVGNDGGVYKQYSANPTTDDFSNTKWGKGANQGFYTLMNYGISAAKDCTVVYGLQDNASGKIEPVTHRQVRTYVGDGMWTAVDPNKADLQYVQTPGLAINRTADGGATFTNIAPSNIKVGVAQFLSPFVMDPLDSKHLVAAGTMVAELLNAETAVRNSWITVFDLGKEPSGVLHQTRSRALEVNGDAVYAGWCGPCNLVGSNLQFKRGLATNVGGSKPAKKGTSDGWHQASLKGLPNRYIYDIEIDPSDTKTIYVTLGGYSPARWAGVGQHLDTNPNVGQGHVFKSTDAGETFVDISGNLPDATATAILKRGEQLIVATDVGIFISKNLLSTQWTPLGDLPAVPTNQLILHPADDRILLAGTFGRGVQNYVFNDRGETPFACRAKSTLPISTPVVSVPDPNNPIPTPPTAPVPIPPSVALPVKPTTGLDRGRWGGGSLDWLVLLPLLCLVRRRTA